jgi:general secretion pathway protein G
VKEAQLRDKWGNPYQYALPGSEGRRYDLISYGADGKPGGDGENRDLTN